MITVIRDVTSFHRLRDEWTDLLSAGGSWNPFLSWEWMWAWWTHLRQNAALHILTVRHGDRLIALAPLMAVRRGLSVPARLEFIGTGAAGADYLDIIIRKGHETAAIDALSRHLGEQQLSLHLDNLPPRAHAAALTLTGWTAIEGSPDVCPYIDLTARTWESYLASLGSSHRANFRRRLRGLEADFQVSFALVESHADRRRVTEALFHFHDQRWNDCGGSTAFSTTPLRAFHQDLTRAALEGAWLRMYALTLNGEIAAAMYGFARDRRFYFYQHGFDVAYSHYSLGLVLMGLTIRAAIADRMDEFDMLYGHEPYKKLWAGRQRPLGRLMLFPPRLAGRWLRRRAETRLAVRALAHRLGLHGWKGSHGAA